MNEWISFEERWPIQNHKVTVKMGDRMEIAMLVNRKMLFADQEKMRARPPTEEVTHWRAGRWL